MGKKIRFLYFIIAILFCISFMGCNSSGKTDGSSEVKIWSIINTEKIMQDDKVGNGDKKIVFNTIKGDVESAQIMFTPNHDVASFSFAMGELSNDNGNKLSVDLFDVFVERYINVSIPTSNGCYAGYYPDALIPIKNYIAKRENKVSKDCNQGIWINFNVPIDAVAGNYSGFATLTVDEKDYEIPVSVTIFNIEMPTEIHTKSAFYLDISMIGSGEGKTSDELVKMYYDFLVEKRANSMFIPGYYGINQKIDAEVFADGIVDYVLNPRVSAFALPYCSGANGAVDYNYCVELLTELAEKNIELIESGTNINLFEKAYYYLGAIIDEPTPNTYNKVRECDYNIQTAKLYVASTKVLDEYPEIKDSLLSLPHIVTTKINNLLYGTDEVGGVQTWCPLIDNFASESFRELAIDRMNSTDRTGGEGVWWYTCCNPKNPYPTYHIDEDLLVSRLRGWMQYDYKIQGSLYWHVNYWQRYINSQAVSTDIWTEPLSWEGANGDGRLIYPGSKYGVKGPISSLRLENLRESNEDYEMLWLFEQTINDINNNNSKSYDSDKILESFYNQVFEDMFVKDGADHTTYSNTRIELMKLLEKMINNPSSAFATLDSLN